MAWRESWWHIIRDKVILLERGQVFEIEGKSFFAFGGASSHDIQGGILDRQTVDYVVTHCCGSLLQERLNAGTGRSCAPDLLTDYLETLEQKLHYRHWYFGHYHRDCQPDDRHTLVYYAILPLEQKENANAVPVPDQTEGEKDHGKG